jgi:hypothetical protein
MDSVSLPLPVGAGNQEVGNIQESAQCKKPQPQDWKRLLLPMTAVVLWLAVGSTLTWLLKDFNRSLEPETSLLSPWLIFSLFLIFAVAIGVFSWKSWRNAPQGKILSIKN